MSSFAGVLWYYSRDGIDNGDMGLLPFDDRLYETAATNSANNTIQQSTGNRLIILRTSIATHICIYVIIIWTQHTLGILVFCRTYVIIIIDTYIYMYVICSYCVLVLVLYGN